MIDAVTKGSSTILKVVKSPHLFATPHFVYYAGYLPDLYETLLATLAGKWAKNYSRNSCLVSFDDTRSYYDGIPVVDTPKIITELRSWLETQLQIGLDFCLIHHYPDGSAQIGYHADKEADKSYVVSVSFGATRKFRFRKKGESSGFAYELALASGDIVVMLPGCQNYYTHSVPIEKKVKTGRLNLTFRQKQS